MVLVDAPAEPADLEASGATHVGRVPWQSDDVDGVTSVKHGGWARPGEFLRVRVDGCEDVDFQATAIP